MKKFFMMMALAAMTMTVGAQNASEFKSWENKSFACQYPGNFEADDPEDEGFFANMFVAQTDDDKHKMQISYNDVTKSNEQEFKYYADNLYKVFNAGGSYKADAPVYKGLTMTMRRELINEKDFDGEMVKMVTYDFACVAPKSKRLFTGEISFPVSEEGTYKPLIEKILSSIKEK